MLGDSLINQQSVLYAGGNELSNIDAVGVALATTTVGTWEFLVRPVDATPASSERMVSFGDTDVNEYINIFIHTSGTINSVCVKAGVTQWAVDTDVVELSDNTWAKIGLVQPADGNGVIIYVNGLSSDQTFTNNFAVDAWFNNLGGLDNGRIGTLNQSNNGELFHINAYMDEIRFYNVAKSAAQMLDSHNGGVPKAADTVGLVSEFRIDGDIVPNMIDNFGGNDGTYVNVVQGEITNVVL